MSQASRVHEGHYVDYKPGTNVPAGTVVVQGTLVGIPSNDIPANRLGGLAVDGVFDVAKATGAITAGAVVYWDADGNPNVGDAGTGAATTTSTSNTAMGKAVQDAASGDATVRILLNR